MKSPTILILHGWNLSSAQFLPLSRLLKKNNMLVFCPDMPGFGSEPAPNKPWHVYNYSEFIHSYIQKNKLKSPIIIGHSFGGRVAIVLAQKYSKDIRAIVLTGTPAYSPVGKKKMSFFLILAKLGGLLFRIAPFSLLADVARRLLYRLAGAHEFYKAKGTMRQTFKNIVQDDLESAMKDITIPTLLVWGEQDSIVPPEVATRMKNTIPKSKLVIIKGRDHGVPFRDPQIFYMNIKEFLQSR